MKVIALVRHGRGLPAALALGETTAVGLTPPGAEGALAAALAAGAARAVALWSPELAETDYLGLASVLATLARHLGFDVVVAGEGARGAIAPSVAERLALPHLSGVTAAEPFGDGARVVARRRSGAALHRFAGTPPLVLGVRGTPLGLRSSEASPVPAGAAVERIEPSAAGINPAELAWRRRFRPRPADGPAHRPRLFPDAASLASRLAADGLLPRRRS